LRKQLAELVPEKQRALEEANTSIRAVNAALDKKRRAMPSSPSFWYKAWRTNGASV
jgi:hypothetical protein